MFQDNWVMTGYDEEPVGELAQSLTQLAIRCIADLNKVCAYIAIVKIHIIVSDSSLVYHAHTVE